MGARCASPVRRGTGAGSTLSCERMDDANAERIARLIVGEDAIAQFGLRVCHAPMFIIRFGAGLAAVSAMIDLKT